MTMYMELGRCGGLRIETNLGSYSKYLWNVIRVMRKPGSVSYLGTYG